MTHTGRFAPSPSGPLHAGSLLAALASFLDARHHQGRWLLRIEDIDAARSRSDAVEDILRCLAAHGLAHDGDIVYQSDRLAHYEAALDVLWDSGSVYGCECTRAALKATQDASSDNPLYTGTCRSRELPREGNACRLRVEAGEVQWNTLSARAMCEDVKHSVGDFVLKRRDGVIAYQLAVVVDDADFGVTSVVRGADLADNTGRQVYLQHALGLTTPVYLHVPLLIGTDGRKLSKSNGAEPCNSAHALSNLLAAWRQLKQVEPPQKLSSVDDFLRWAIPRWNAEATQ